MRESADEQQDTSPTTTPTSTPGTNTQTITTTSTDNKKDNIEVQNNAQAEKERREFIQHLKNNLKRTKHGYEGLKWICENATVKFKNTLNENIEYDFYLLDEEEEQESNIPKKLLETKKGDSFYRKVTQELNAVKDYRENEIEKYEEDFPERNSTWNKICKVYNKTISPQIDVPNAESKEGSPFYMIIGGIYSTGSDVPAIIKYRRKQYKNRIKAWIVRFTNWFKKKKTDQESDDKTKQPGTGTNESLNINSNNYSIDDIFNETLYFSTSTLPIITEDITPEEMLLVENVSIDQLLIELDEALLSESAIFNGIVGTIGNVISNIIKLFYKRDEAINNISDGVGSAFSTFAKGIKGFAENGNDILSYDKWRPLIENSGTWEILVGGIALLTAFGIFRRTFRRVSNWFKGKFYGLIGSDKAEYYRNRHGL